MASRILTSSQCLFRQAPTIRHILPNSTRAFTSSSSILRQEGFAAATPVVRKPVGAFRGGMFGFLLGTTLAGAGTWFYIMEEYRVSNELLTEDIYALQAAVQRIHSLVIGLEEKVILMEQKNKK